MNKHLLKTFVYSIIGIMILNSCEEKDTTPPDVSISSPANGATVSDTVTIKALVADDSGVESVEFYIDGDLLTTDSEAPYEAVWITNDYTNGSHTLHCKAIDESDNEALSESIQVTVSNIILTAAFTDDWLCLTCGEGILFYSDMDGNLLWTGTWSGNESVDILPTEEVSDFPDRIMVTTVISNPNNDFITLTTNISVIPESWTWKGSPYNDNESLGEVSLDLQNVPDHQGYTVASAWNRSRSRSGTISSIFSKTLYQMDDDIYLRLNTTNNGPSYRWIEDVSPGDNILVDLQNMSTLSSKVISLPTQNDENISYTLRAFFNDDYYSSYFDIDNSYGHDYDEINNTYTTYYPPGLFTNYRTRLYLNEEEYPTYNYWHYWVIDDAIPDVIETTTANFEFISTSPTDFEIQVTGDYNQSGSYWVYNDGTRDFLWRVWGLDESYALPELSDYFSQVYPGVSRESFTLEYANIVYRPQINNNDELIEIIFQSEDRFYDVIHESFERFKDPDGLRP